MKAAASRSLAASRRATRCSSREWSRRVSLRYRHQTPRVHHHGRGCDHRLWRGVLPRHRHRPVPSRRVPGHHHPDASFAAPTRRPSRPRSPTPSRKRSPPSARSSAFARPAPRASPRWSSSSSSRRTSTSPTRRSRPSSARSARNCPGTSKIPIIEKFDIDAAPIMTVVVSGDLSPRELTRLADKTVKERLQRVPNVGQVKLVGGRDREIWFWLNRDKLEGYGLAVQDVIAALQTEHIEYPGGRVETGSKEYVVKTKAEFESAEQFANMVVAYRKRHAGPRRGPRPRRGRPGGGAHHRPPQGRAGASPCRSAASRAPTPSRWPTPSRRRSTKLGRELGPRGIRLEIGAGPLDASSSSRSTRCSSTWSSAAAWPCSSSSSSCATSAAPSSARWSCPPPSSAPSS